MTGVYLTGRGLVRNEIIRPLSTFYQPLIIRSPLRNPALTPANSGPSTLQRARETVGALPYVAS